MLPVNGKFMAAQPSCIPDYSLNPVKYPYGVQPAQRAVQRRRDNWIGKVAAAVLKGPEASSSVLIVTWDDCGCFYDQVPPPVAPDGRTMGTRVPFVMAGPMVKPGYTDSTVTSSPGSILAFIEYVFGLPALGPNDARAYNLSGMLNLTPGAARVKTPRFVWRHLPARKYRVQPSTLRDGT